MSVRRLFRGWVSWEAIESIARELADRYDQDVVRVEFFDVDNWLSTPCVVNETWFVKIVTRQNALVHALFTGARNLGAFSSGSEGFFERFESPLAMAEHEVESTRRMREIGLNAPRPIESFESSGRGVIVLEYLENSVRLDELSGDEIEVLTPDLFSALATMHVNELAHGDLRAENVLVQDGVIYFIDVTAVSTRRLPAVRSYDVASALAALTPHVGAAMAVDGARQYYDEDVLVDAVDFLDFVNIRPDHDFDAPAVKGEVAKIAGT